MDENGRKNIILKLKVHSSLNKTSSGMCQMWGSKSTQRERKENRTYPFKKNFNFVFLSQHKLLYISLSPIMQYNNVMPIFKTLL